MDMIFIDTVSVIIAAFLFIIISAFWFSNIMFKKIYFEQLGIEEKAISCGWRKWLGTILVAFLFSYSMALLQALLGVMSILEGLYVSLGLYIGFLLPSYLMALMWANKSCKVFFIEAGYWFFIFLVLGGFLGA
jgi:hypothetical protein